MKSGITAVGQLTCCSISIIVVLVSFAYHMAQLIPLPLTVFSKIQIGFTGSRGP